MSANSAFGQSLSTSAFGQSAFGQSSSIPFESEWSKFGRKWPRRLPLLQSRWDIALSQLPEDKRKIAKGTWVKVLVENSRPRAGCIACNFAYNKAHYSARTARGFAKMGIKSPKVSVFKKHHTLAEHKNAVLQMLGISDEYATSFIDAPTHEEFKKAWQQFRNGVSFMQAMRGWGSEVNS